ncbi:hypothetical protein CWI84_05415 [Idiomarina tyrosinivorans]|uniref:Uncharacterized protein n=1 Tax=Idiomarina tyrosinivorans TaxID=1445662 RepID=A0A432ZRN9_9GAMM|nr:hypothetical protein [Idiomarina tyrosinivorans]RUO80496.1 hypothetical protein CWI84_05415 [Idiomarina tyrosinivorans]
MLFLNDVPATLQVWEWQSWQTENLLTSQLWYLTPGQELTLKQLQQHFPDCPQPQAQVWVCMIDQQLWSIMKHQDGQWWLMRLSNSPVSQQITRGVLGVRLMASSNDQQQVTLWTSRRSLARLLSALQFRFGQDISAIHRPTPKQAFIEFNDGAMLTIEQQAQQTISVWYQPDV